MKRFVIFFSVFLLILLAGAVVAPSFIDWNTYKPQAVETVKKLTGHDMEIDGNIGLSILPAPYVFVENVRVLSPAGFKSKNLAEIKRLDVNLSLLPLLSGNVEVSKVTLIKPDIHMEVNAQNQQNWMTPELQSMSEKKDDVSAQNKNAAPKLSFDDVQIEGGKYSYLAGEEKQPLEIKDINLAMSAGSVAGPFALEGSFAFMQQVLEVDLKTKTIVPETNELSMNLALSDGSGALVLNYAGIAELQAPFDVQGEIDLALDTNSKTVKAYIPSSTAKFLKDVRVKGLLTASQKQIKMSNATLALAGQTLKGSMDIKPETFNIAGAFVGTENINLDPLLSGVQAGSGGASTGSVSLDAMLPASLTLPAGASVDVRLSFPGLIVRKELFEEVEVALVKQEKSFKGQISAEKIPAKGKMDAHAALVYGASSVSEKTGQEVFSDPRLGAGLNLQTQNLGQVIALFAPTLENPQLNALKSADIKLNAEMTDDKLTIQKSDITLGDQRLAVSGTVAFPKLGKRGALDLDVSANRFDLKPYMESDPNAPPADIKKIVQSLSMPYDAVFDIGVQTLVLPAQTASGVRLQGRVDDKSLHLDNLSAQDFAGLQAKISGAVGDYRNLDKLSLKLDAQTENSVAFLNAMGIESTGLPKDLKATRVSADLNGNVDAMDVNADIQAIGAKFNAKGKITNALTAPAYKDMFLRIQHPNTNQFIQALSPGSEGFSTLSKPMDVQANIDMTGRRLSLTGLKGDVAGTSLSGQASYDYGQAVPDMNVQLAFGDLVLKRSSFTPSVERVRPQSSPAQAPQSSPWSRTPFKVDGLKSMTGKVSVEAKNFVYDAWVFQEPKLALSLAGGIATIDTFRSQMFDGSVSIDGQLKALSGSALEGRLNADVQNVSIEPFMRSITGGHNLKGQGRVSLKTKVSGAGLSPYDFVSSLNGDGQMSGSNLVLEGFDLAKLATALSAELKPGDSLQTLWKGTTSGGTTSFDTMDGTYTINQGIMNIIKMALTGPKADISSIGKVDLPRWYLDTTHTISLKEGTDDLPDFDIKLAGPLNNPGKTFGQGILEDYLKRKINRKLQKIISDKFDLPGLTTKEPAGGDAVPEGGEGEKYGPVTPEEAFKGLLKGLMK